MNHITNRVNGVISERRSHFQENEVLSRMVQDIRNANVDTVAGLFIAIWNATKLSEYEFAQTEIESVERMLEIIRGRIAPAPVAATGQINLQAYSEQERRNARDIVKAISTIIPDGTPIVIPLGEFLQTHLKDRPSEHARFFEVVFELLISLHKINPNLEFNITASNSRDLATIRRSSKLDRNTAKKFKFMVSEAGKEMVQPGLRIGFSQVPSPVISEEKRNSSYRFFHGWEYADGQMERFEKPEVLTAFITAAVTALSKKTVEGLKIADQEVFVNDAESLQFLYLLVHTIHAETLGQKAFTQAA